jgi:hypothetical protein
MSEPVNPTRGASHLPMKMKENATKARQKSSRAHRVSRTVSGELNR